MLQLFSLLLLLILASCNNATEAFSKESIAAVNQEEISKPDPSKENDQEKDLDESEKPSDEAKDEVIPENILCKSNPEALACRVKPVAVKPSVVTILLTLSQIAQDPAQLIAVNVVKYVSPVESPKILLLQDSNLHGEDVADVDYVRSLLKNYDVTFQVIPAGGLEIEATSGFDLIWVINPGHPLQDAKTRDSLMRFSGSVVIQGDDMAAGNEALSGLKFVDNGTSVGCSGNSYGIDNLSGHNYDVAMNSEFLPGIAVKETFSKYGNDIDNTIAGVGVKVLAYASIPSDLCSDPAPRPAITVREK